MGGYTAWQKNRGGPNGTAPHPKELYVTVCPPAHCYRLSACFRYTLAKSTHYSKKSRNLDLVEVLPAGL